jgi:hypothetical protein
LTIVTLILLIAVMVFAAGLFLLGTSTSSKKKKEVAGGGGAFDTLQLSDGGIVAYELLHGMYTIYKWLFRNN